MKAPALQQHYKEKVVPALKQKMGYTNLHQVPRLEKIVVTSCMGKAPDRKIAVDDAVNEIQKITGHLFSDKCVIRLVGVERSDHPIPVAPRIGHHLVLVLTIGVGISRQIQPPTSPPLSVGRRCQIPIHHPLVGIG